MLRAGCKATIAANYSGERLVDGSSGDLDAHRRVARRRRSRPTAGSFYIGRADCRTDAQRGADDRHRARPPASSTSRTATSASAAATSTSGIPQHVQRHRQQRRHAGRHPARLRRPRRRRRDQRQDRVRPARRRRVARLRARPATSTCSTSRPSTRTTRSTRASPTATSGASRRWARPRISRFTVNLQTKQLELDSEVVIFEYDSQICSCCHRGGGMGFDSEGNLYVTTGDSNSSQRTNGYSGNYQPARCPTGPRTWPPTPTAAATTSRTTTRAARPAAPTITTARCCASTPSTRSPTGRSRRSASTARTRCRTRTSPNGANLFNGTEGNGSQAKPEIYAMGLRNPSRLFIDPETDIPYSAWVGPDAGRRRRPRARRRTRTPRSSPTAGNYGWPYCMGNQQAVPRPRRRRLAAHHQRRRLRQRRPGRQPDAGLVRLQQPRQRLDEQHRPDRAAARDRHGEGRRHARGR